MGSDASGSSEKYCMMCTHTQITNFEKFYKTGKFSLKFLLDVWEFQMLGYQITRSLLQQFFHYNNFSHKTDMDAHLLKIEHFVCLHFCSNTNKLRQPPDSYTKSKIHSLFCHIYYVSTAEYSCTKACEDLSATFTDFNTIISPNQLQHFLLILLRLCCIGILSFNFSRMWNLKDKNVFTATFNPSF
jgi:hypothetical protein